MILDKEEFTSKWGRMLDVQENLDKQILQEYGPTYADLYNSDYYSYALMYLLGELSHELKAYWPWHKKTIEPVDMMKVKDKFIDCLQIILSWQNAIWEVMVEPNYVIYPPVIKAWNAYKRDESTTVPMAARYVNGIPKWCGFSYVEPPVGAIIRVMNGLGLRFEEVYETYMEKNQGNSHER